GGAGGEEGTTEPSPAKASRGGCALGGSGSGAGLAWIVVAFVACRRRGGRRSPAGLAVMAFVVLATTVSCAGTSTGPGPSGEAGAGGDGDGTGGAGSPTGGTRATTGGTGG